VAKHGLKSGLELSLELIQKLKDNDEKEYIYAKILNFLSYRPHSVKEVRDRLYKYKVTERSAQDEHIVRLQESGYLDDLSFARWFIASRNASRPRSPRMLSQELLVHGVSKDIVSEVINEVDSPTVTIHRILGKKWGSPRSLSLAERQKIHAYLMRQGFSWSDVSEVVKSWESE
jgi:regulatory protein